MNCYEPEGRKIAGTANQRYCGSLEGLREAMAEGVILEGWGARISGARPDLLVDLGGIQGVIPHDEGALGMEDGSTRDIALLTRVGKPVCFVVTGFEELADGTLRPVLSRRQAQQRCQEEYLDTLVPGDIISARVTHLEPFGCFVDIGCGIASLLPIDAISVSRIAHPSDRFRVGEEIRVVVRSRDEKNRITLTHRELLGTWEENAAAFCAGDTVPGIVRSVEDYGIFIELTPNLAGLTEPRPGVYPGQRATVTIKSLNPARMKVKLILIDSFDQPGAPREMSYFVQGDHIDRWEYSPAACARKIVTDFSAVRAQ